jgi:ubiquinone/menaquinone biosynthesis C-methylase UbiE/uncharacterized protein YbaR (Trm112 family)
MPHTVINRYNINVLECPACHTPKLLAKAEKLVCQGCLFEFDVHSGIPVLLTDKTLATQLEKIDYDDHHNIDDERRQKVCNDWKIIFDEHGVNYGDVLEIGSGTGQLTWGLARSLPFKTVNACDISSKFLDGVRSNLLNQPGDAHVNYYACDANNLPFKKNSFDLVVGHSVLHHFIDYDKTIERAFELLRPGGRAIFYEPVMQGKAFVAFFAELMLRIEARTQWGVLDEQDIKKIEHMIRHIIKEKWIGNNRERLSKVEDKHVFDIHKMRDLSKKLGFSDFAYNNFYNADWGYKSHWAQHLLMAGISAKKIEQYAFISNAFGKIYSDMLPRDIATPMGYFTFIK